MVRRMTEIFEFLDVGTGVGDQGGDFGGSERAAARGELFFVREGVVVGEGWGKRRVALALALRLLLGFVVAGWRIGPTTVGCACC